VNSVADSPRVSVVIPCRDEVRFIASCLDDVEAFDYPQDLMELEVVDGMSTDGTREILGAWAESGPRRRMLDNPKKTAAAAMNVGIAASTGDVIVRLDAHARYPAEYVRSCVDALVDTGADIAGGTVRTLPGGTGAMPAAIAVAVSSRFGVGGTAFRVGGVERPMQVDIVPYGCFKRSLMESVGWYDESMLRDEDADFCFRVTAQGGRVLLCPGIHSTYVARRRLWQLWVQYFLYGFYKPTIARKVHKIMTVRQVVPPVFVSSLLVFGVLSFWNGPARLLLALEAALYAAAVIEAAVVETMSHRDWRLILLSLVYPVMHVAYGVGYAVGSVRRVRGTQP
jgi:cellulose synthase/poly-beta-1,6-N-acetylglucosamine synthase-like glycosyltransferase